MIQQHSILKVADNSGAKTVKCIKVNNKNSKSCCNNLGKVATVSIKQLRNKLKKTSKVLKGEVFKALIVRENRPTRKKDGSCLFLKENAVVLISKQGNLVGSRIIGPTPKMLRKKRLTKFISLSTASV